MRSRELKLIILTLLLITIGLFSIYSSTISKVVGKNLSPFIFVERQLSALLIGGILFLIILSFPYRTWERSWMVIYTINLILLIAVMVAGRRSLGAQRWFSIFGFSFQPSEFSKLFIILSFSGYFHEIKKGKGELGFKEFIFAIFLLFLTLLFVFLQPDLGTTIIIALTGVFIFILGGIPYKYILRSFMVILLFLPFFWLILKPYQQQRIISFLDPSKDPLGSGYQVLQSLIAVGSGGIFGKGWLGGQQTHLNLIPEQHTDFIFSVIGEEFGFIGGIVLLVIYYLLFYYSWQIYVSTLDDFGKFLAGGILFNWVTQTFINIAMVLGLLPVVGVPLPFVSFARTSLITNLIMLSFLVNISLRSGKVIYG